MKRKLLGDGRREGASAAHNAYRVRTAAVRTVPEVS